LLKYEDNFTSKILKTKKKIILDMMGGSVGNQAVISLPVKA
jgi:hypothetical protein